jgi:DAK2 domain fusion protein YloV
MAALEFLDGASVRRWCELATKALGSVREQIDALNVFPVADSDTGTNLYITMLAAAKALDGLPETADAGDIWQALARGMLLGAHGNSGVIISQYLRGLAEVCGPASPCDGAVVTRALAHAARLSHAAVGEPVEGTVLTVASAGARSAAASGGGLAAVAMAAAEGAREALARTTAQLDVLARSGVVDAGAAGLCVLIDTFASVVAGTRPEWYPIPVPAVTPAWAGDHLHTPDGHDGDQAGTSAGYEVMYLLEAADEPVAQLRERLRALGDSLVVVGGEELWNVHIHTPEPGAAIEAGIAVGRPYRIRVTYLGVPGAGHVGSSDVGSGDVDHGRAGSERDGSAAASPGARTGAADGSDAEAASSDHAVVAVVRGEGLARLFAEAGAVVVHTDHDRQPEQAELVSALRRAAEGARRVAVLPGDPAVSALTEKAAAQIRNEGTLVRVLPAEAAVQSLSALAMHDPASPFEDDVAAMEDSVLATRWGQVKLAADERAAGAEAVPAAGDTNAAAAGDTNAAAAGDTNAAAAAAGRGRADAFAGFVGYVGDGAVTSGADAAAVAAEVADLMLAAGGDLVTLLSGTPGRIDGSYGRQVADLVTAHLYATRPDVEVVSHDGGETSYLLVIGVE